MGDRRGNGQAELRARPGRCAARLDRRARVSTQVLKAGPGPVSHLRRQPARGRRRSRARRSSTGAAFGTRRERCPCQIGAAESACTSSSSSPPTDRSATRRSSSARPRSARLARRGHLPHEHLAGVQLLGRGRQRLGRHVVRRPAAPEGRADRPFLRRGVPPFFYRYDQGFLHWLYWTGKTVDFLAETDLDDALRRELAAAYDLIVFPGHTEYVTDPRVRRRRSGTATSAGTWCSCRRTTSSGASRRTARCSCGRPSGATSAGRRRPDRRAVPRQRPRRAPGPVHRRAMRARRRGSGTAPGSTTARPSARPSAATGSRSTTRRRRRRPARSCSREIPDLFGPG